MPDIDPWYLDHLVCPAEGGPLRCDGRDLVSGTGRRYPIVDGVPVMLLTDRRQTIRLARASIERAHGRVPTESRFPHFYVETLALGTAERERLVQLAAGSECAIDPVALMLLRATSGHAYADLVGNTSLRSYPIPRIGLSPGRGRSLLDLGCSWGRWSLAAARADYRVVGLDPSLGAVMAARRIAGALGHEIRWVVGDARWLPFRAGAFDTVHAYSVLQHFAKDDARRALAEAGRVLAAGGIARIQLASRAGLRSLQHQWRRRFREPQGFEVRYWSLREMRQACEAAIGPVQLSSDGYFGLGWQWQDFAHMPARLKPVLIASEGLRRASVLVPLLRRIADSIVCTAERT
ncbi:Methyltransferase domain-containing protein [Methylobacterium sp. 174MFSha1.1]|uniref:methyltransferase domain-containing protein n=1 Tax=Methylobacterium sp. 174MFSha1.1 TaxID=1502749 RepID=UPI0008E9BF15|nr:methyltransferase domain-containing protein [Methylobacterium sp. 174MFSha1.1]SFU97138.1 Methyltransferase domain-containing protein [Methylobacterium sp. 174MFSha1.1]